MIQMLFRKMGEYLPVFVPLSLVGFSVVVRFFATKDRPRFRDLLKYHTEIALGVLSFAVWALIELLQSGTIEINDHAELTKVNFGMLFLLDMLIVVTTNLAAKHDWSA